MMRKPLLMLVFVVASPTVEVWGDSTPPELKHNPFNYPELVLKNSATNAGTVVTRWSGVLQATLVAGEDSLANVEGNLVGLGEDYNGFRLLSVGEGIATFIKDDVQITVVVGNDGDSDNEN